MDSQEQQAEFQYDTGGETTGPMAGFDEQKAREGARLLLEAVGRNPDEAGVYDTWYRRVPAMLETLTEGTRHEEKPVMRTFEAETDSLVVKTSIPLHSMCEHHLLPFDGVAHVAYRPDEEMVGLSKLIRYVRWQSRQLTTQEALTHDIATGLAEELNAGGVTVEVTATHMCEVMRGVETATETTTRAEAGSLTDADREQFRESVRRHSASAATR
ncbi:GTP cyclohydrolase I FolE [Haloarcula pellucida]|uniref:GTP cyclohydrolase I n=1 Tax=Haloarcula pellucida TaxID=1427151 RepID=A0A830GM66_9EURY|nr:GTP cyclohydrolase I FolE [Halomicroarcula pellucida]MBX0349829.1 GTP cyclohydrolase I [Halomicroarcula pellucida]GGN94565.1 GTP cyclohydrolase 1 [Halomicroarcula pellucida]